MLGSSGRVGEVRVGRRAGDELTALGEADDHVVDEPACIGVVLHAADVGEVAEGVAKKRSGCTRPPPRTTCRSLPSNVEEISPEVLKSNRSIRLFRAGEVAQVDARLPPAARVVKQLLHVLPGVKRRVVVVGEILRQFRFGVIRVAVGIQQLSCSWPASATMHRCPTTQTRARCRAWWTFAVPSRLRHPCGGQEVVEIQRGPVLRTSSLRG